VLDPFRPRCLHSRIHPGQRVCGTAWVEKKRQLVPAVLRLSQGILRAVRLLSPEIVIPVFKEGEVNKMVLGCVDSDQAG